MASAPITTRAAPVERGPMVPGSAANGLRDRRGPGWCETKSRSVGQVQPPGFEEIECLHERSAVAVSCRLLGGRRVGRKQAQTGNRSDASRHLGSTSLSQQQRENLVGFRNRVISAAPRGAVARSLSTTEPNHAAPVELVIALRGAGSRPSGHPGDSFRFRGVARHATA